MSADLTPRHHGLAATLDEWLKGLKQRWDAAGELGRLDREEVERIAHDVGLTGRELSELAAYPGGSARLLEECMAALGLDRAEVVKASPRVLADLQRLCTLCEHKGLCAEDLARDKDAPGWEAYCPNALTLEALETEAKAKASDPSAAT